MDDVSELLCLVLLFALESGITATVDTSILKGDIRSKKGIAVGLFSQFFILPFLGFCSAMAFHLDPVYGISLLAVTCAPGGTYSNSWCALFNADVPASVVMTACSTLASLVFIPINMTLYIRVLYHTSISLNWLGVIASLAISLSGMVFGLAITHFFPAWRTPLVLGGCIAGVVLGVLGVVEALSNDPFQDRGLGFWFAVPMPAVLGLVGSGTLGALCRLSGPTNVAVSVETCYQNVGVALVLALSCFPDEEQGKAACVPMYYCCVKLILLPVFLTLTWKCGLTYAPTNVSFHKMLAGSFQPADCDVFKLVHPAGDANASARPTADPAGMALGKTGSQGSCEKSDGFSGNANADMDDRMKGSHRGGDHRLSLWIPIDWWLLTPAAQNKNQESKESASCEDAVAANAHDNSSGKGGDHQVGNRWSLSTLIRGCLPKNPMEHGNSACVDEAAKVCGRVTSPIDADVSDSGNASERGENRCTRLNAALSKWFFSKLM